MITGKYLITVDTRTLSYRYLRYIPIPTLGAVTVGTYVWWYRTTYLPVGGAYPNLVFAGSGAYLLT